MLCKPRQGLFVTGTDTGVGKTFVTALLARHFARQGHRVGVYKPVASGCRRDGTQLVADDALQLWRAIDSRVPLERVCPQTFQAPLAPHLAARAAGIRVDARLLRHGLSWWHDQCDLILVEGAGGLLSPVSDKDFVADLAYEFGYPLLVVAPNQLGVINQTLQTLVTAATFRDGLSIAGIILNDVRPPEAETDPSCDSNRDELIRLCLPPVIAHLRYQATVADLAKLRWSDLSP